MSAEHDEDGATGDRSGRGDTSDHAYRMILEAIVGGQLPQGGRLRESDLAQLTGVSRTPVREALNRLKAEGVVQQSKNRGAQLIPFTQDDALALLELRARFEPYATRLAVHRMTEDDVALLTDLTDQMEKAVLEKKFDPMEISRLNNEFHSLFIERSGNFYLCKSLQPLVVPAYAARTFHRYTRLALDRSLSHHRELVEAISARAPDWAESVMRSHILAARHAYS